MACYSPMDGYRLEGGAVSIGYEPQGGSVEKLRIPCGSCFGCRMEYADSWATRLEHESACWSSSEFVTLTYDEDNIAWHGSLVLDDLQRFLKRLRKSHEGVDDVEGSRPIRYFAAGEYGGETGRPHFHVALFNTQFASRHSSWCVSDAISALWPYGNHQITAFTPGRARYIAGYAVKKVRGRMARERAYSVVHPETGELVERRPEFVVMSRRPGIGALWYEKFHGDLNRGYVVMPGGVKKRLPRYYRERLMRDADFADAASERRAEYLARLVPGEDTPERRAAKELVHRSRVAAYGKARGL